MALQNLMWHRVTIKRPTASKDASGGITSTESAVYTDLPANVQPVSASVSLLYQQRQLTVTHSVYTNQAISARNGDRVYFGTRTFIVTGFRDGLTLSAAASGTVHFSGDISQNTTTAGGIIKNGAGVVILSGNNTFTGTSEVLNGMLRLGSSTAMNSRTLEVDTAENAEKLKAYMPAIRNNVLMILAHKTSEELLTRSGKERLAREIMRESVRPMGIEIEPDEEDTAESEEGAKPHKKKRRAVYNPVQQVHFSNFIVQ